MQSVIINGIEYAPVKKVKTKSNRVSYYEKELLKTVFKWKQQ